MSSKFRYELNLESILPNFIFSTTNISIFLLSLAIWFYVHYTLLCYKHSYSKNRKTIRLVGFTPDQCLRRPDIKIPKTCSCVQSEVTDKMLWQHYLQNWENRKIMVHLSNDTFACFFAKWPLQNRPEPKITFRRRECLSVWVCASVCVCVCEWV